MTLGQEQAKQIALRLAGNSHSRTSARFDLLFEDRSQSNILMELKAVTAKYQAADQLRKYKGEYGIAENSTYRCGLLHRRCRIQFVADVRDADEPCIDLGPVKSIWPNTLTSVEVSRSGKSILLPRDLSVKQLTICSGAPALKHAGEPEDL